MAERSGDESVNIDDLVARMLAHAKRHDEVVPHDDERRQWAEDLRTAAAELRRLHRENTTMRAMLGSSSSTSGSSDWAVW